MWTGVAIASSRLSCMPSDFTLGIFAYCFWQNTADLMSSVYIDLLFMLAAHDFK